MTDLPKSRGNQTFPFGLIICAIGALTFMAMIFWFIDQHKHSGRRFPDRKGVPFSVIILGWLMFVAGGLTAGVANGAIPT